MMKALGTLFAIVLTVALIAVGAYLTLTPYLR